MGKNPDYDRPPVEFYKGCWENFSMDPPFDKQQGVLSIYSLRIGWRVHTKVFPRTSADYWKNCCRYFELCISIWRVALIAKKMSYCFITEAGKRSAKVH